jgi:D-arabinose 1-dehydrogenase-like Zn-dependent alcohol dehydrogenase
MRAAIVPLISSAWEFREVPTPEPGPNQVLLKIHASGICYTDVHQTRGELPGSFPRTLGHEPVGEIVAVGAGVTARKAGDRVGDGGASRAGRGPQDRLSHRGRDRRLEESQWTGCAVAGLAGFRTCGAYNKASREAFL